MRVILIVLLLVSTFLSTQGNARDINGQFAVKGVGNVSCAKFVDIVEDAQNEQKFLFVGWLNGYLTAHNYYLPDTFDLVSWENVDTLTYYLIGHCKKYPAMSFFQATTQLSNSLHDFRIDKLMSKDGKLDKTQSTQLYFQVKVMLQQRLAALGFYKGEIDGDLGPSTLQAIQQYKVKNGLLNTQQIDQQVLFSLLKNKADP